MASLVYNWQVPAGGQPASYNLYEGASGAETLLVNVAGTVLTYTHTGVGVGTKYAVVKAVYAGVESAASNEVVATVVPPPPAPAPSSIRQGTTVSFTPDSLDLPAGGMAWDLLLHGVITYTSANPGTGAGQWLVYYSNGIITISAPKAAYVDTGYELRVDTTKF